MGSIGVFVLEWYTRQMATGTDPYLPNNPTQAFCTRSSGLGPKYNFSENSKNV